MSPRSLLSLNRLEEPLQSEDEGSVGRLAAAGHSALRAQVAALARLFEGDDAFRERVTEVFRKD